LPDRFIDAGPGTKVVATVSTPGRSVANVRFTLK